VVGATEIRQRARRGDDGLLRELWLTRLRAEQRDQLEEAALARLDRPRVAMASPAAGLIDQTWRRRMKTAAMRDEGDCGAGGEGDGSRAAWALGQARPGGEADGDGADGVEADGQAR
jgi:hypothetical protein